MKASELKRWAATALPGTMVPAEQVAEMEIDEAPASSNGAGASVHPRRNLTAEEYADQVCGGAVAGKTVARWCREKKIAGARQLPNGTWLCPADSPPPEKGAEVALPGGDVGSLQEHARRLNGKRKE